MVNESCWFLLWKKRDCAEEEKEKIHLDLIVQKKTLSHWKEERLFFQRLRRIHGLEIRKLILLKLGVWGLK